jgi:signal transduction histidine kinase
MSEGPPATILFVDDDAAQRHALSWVFRNAGFRIAEAGTGREALLRVRERPDVVVLDVNLPDLNGFEVCRRIKADPATRSVGVLQVSAVFVQSDDRAQGLEGGADGYLVKPVEPRELLAMVGALIRVRQAEAEVRRAAQEWRTTFDAISDAVCLVDAAGTIVRGNRALAELLNRPWDDLLGRPYARVLREALGLTEADAARLPGGGTGCAPCELLLGQRWFHMTADPTVDEHGARAGTVHILTDVTRRKELEDQLRQGQKLEAIGRLAGGVAHDFNNLLTAVTGNAALLLQRLPPGPESELAGVIERAAWRAAELTRQLLGFSRRTLLWLKPTDLNDAVAEVAGLLRHTLDPAAVTLEVSRAAGLWPVQADPGQMNRVLMNLCLNARDAMPRGGTLTLETANVVVGEEYARGRLEARPGAFVRVRVADTGHGIPAELLPRIFEPFFTTKEEGQGTGLGLAMVHGIVRQHQGWVECGSAVGRGTRFDLYVPRLEAAPAAFAPAPAPAEAPRGGSETILVAEDNDMLRTLVATFLRRHGFRVLLAQDGREAVEVFRRQRGGIDLVVLDLMMPHLSGPDALRQLRQIDPDVRAVFASGYADRQPDDDGGGAVRGFIAKPYREADLIRAVRAALDAP